MPEPTHCFAYGSLMWPAIMARVCACKADDLQPVPARLGGHRRHSVRGETYPGLVPSSDPQACVDGVLYRDLHDDSWARLDAFEGEDYERVVVQVSTAEGTRQAWVYRWKADRADRLEPGAWDPDAFARAGRQAFEARFFQGAAPTRT